MAMVKRWFESNERVQAKKEAKSQGVPAWRYERATRAGKLRGFYVGKILPKTLDNDKVQVEQICK